MFRDLQIVTKKEPTAQLVKKEEKQQTFASPVFPGLYNTFPTPLRDLVEGFSRPLPKIQATSR